MFSYVHLRQRTSFDHIVGVQTSLSYFYVWFIYLYSPLMNHILYKHKLKENLRPLFWFICLFALFVQVCFTESHYSENGEMVFDTGCGTPKVYLIFFPHSLFYYFQIWNNLKYSKFLSLTLQIQTIQASSKKLSNMYGSKGVTWNSSLIIKHGHDTKGNAFLFSKEKQKNMKLKHVSSMYVLFDF